MLERIQVEREARAYVAIGEWDKAISLYRELLTKGDDPNVYNLIGDVYTRIGDLQSAAPEYIRAIELYEKEGLFENGIAVCKKVLRIMPERKEIYFNLAVFYSEIGLTQEALNVLKTYAESATGANPLARVNTQKYKKLIKALANEPTLKAPIEEVYNKLGLHDKEIDASFHPQVSETSPTSEKIDTKPSVIEQEQETVVAAKDISPEATLLEKLTKTHKKQPKAENPVLKQQEITEPEDISQPKPIKEEDGQVIGKDLEILLHAINEIKSALHNTKEKTDHYKLGIEYKALNFYDAAIQELQTASANPTYEVKALKELGFCFMQKNELDFAVNAFKRALEKQTRTEDYMGLQYALGSAYQMLGDKESALHSFEEVYLIDIGYKDVKDKIAELSAGGRSASGGKASTA